MKKYFSFLFIGFLIGIRIECALSATLLNNSPFTVLVIEGINRGVSLGCGTRGQQIMRNLKPKGQLELSAARKEGIKVGVVIARKEIMIACPESVQERYVFEMHPEKRGQSLNHALICRPIGSGGISSRKPHYPNSFP